MSDKIFEDFRRIEEQMNKMFEELYGGTVFPLLGQTTRPLLLPEGRSMEKARRPFIDLAETDKDIIATIEMPGLNKEDIKINLTKDRLEVSGETKSEEEKKEKGYIYKERRSGSFYRAVSLPSEVNPDNVKATYNNGVIEIKMPKSEIMKKTSVKVE